MNDYITCLNARVLISFVVEDVLLTIWGALVDGDIQDLLLLDDLLAFACLALVFLIDYFTLALAIIAGSCALGIHSRT